MKRLELILLREKAEKRKENTKEKINKLPTNQMSTQFAPKAFHVIKAPPLNDNETRNIFILICTSLQCQQDKSLIKTDESDMS
jgi:hypothetical protein